MRAIIEILGKPKEHVEATMEVIGENVRKHEAWKVSKFTVAPAEPKDSLYLVFADTEIVFRSFSDIFSFCFEYMPSSLEVIEPTEFELNSLRINGWLNDYLGRLHESDMVAKRVRADNDVLQRNTHNIFRNFLHLALGSGEKTLTELAAITGIPSADMHTFIKPFLSEPWIEETERGFKLHA